MSNTTNILPCFYAGATKIIKFTFENQDITGWKLILVLQDAIEDTDIPILTKTHTVGDNTLDNAASGVCYFTIDSNISNIPIGNYHYQFTREIGNDNPRNILMLVSDKVKVLNRFEET